jgi:hypothetical protein
MKGRLVGLAVICAAAAHGEPTPQIVSGLVNFGFEAGSVHGWTPFNSAPVPYMVSAWVQDSAGTASLYLDGSVHAGTAQTAVANASAGVWQLVQVPFTSQTGFIRIRLWQAGSELRWLHSR